MAVRPPNVLFLIWDACRPDFVAKNAPTLMALAQDNLWFERAIAPAPWSLPSHASIFSGEYPHEHGITRLGDGLADLPLASALGDRGYRCYGVSANGFACQRTGFHAGFDEFYYTRGREEFLDGLNVSGYALEQLYDGDDRKVGPALRTLREALTHEHPLKSLVNAAGVGLGAAAVRSRILQTIPHPLFAADSGYSYSPETNTTRLSDIIRRESESETPFFAFSNYMDTHRPYTPGAEKQRRHIGRELSRSELERLNDEVAEPWRFIADDERGAVADRDVETIRGLYAGEVETIDEHLSRLLKVLKETGQREDTLVVVTSDHGENLGEVDEMGRRRMGHEASISDQLAHVPLVIAHPDIPARRVKEPYSLVDLYDLLTTNDFAFSSGSEIGDDRKFVACEYPPAGGEQLYEKHPDTPLDALDYRIKEASVVVYGANWRVGCESNGNQWAEEDGMERSFDDAPEELRGACETRLDRLGTLDDTATDLDGDEIAQLEALGYL